jgi:hypothetical protein
MTNKEAIEIIKIAKAEIEWNYPLNYNIAFDKAIESLEKESEKIEMSEQEYLYHCNRIRYFFTQVYKFEQLMGDVDLSNSWLTDIVDSYVNLIAKIMCPACIRPEDWVVVFNNTMFESLDCSYEEAQDNFLKILDAEEAQVLVWRYC